MGGEQGIYVMHGKAKSLHPSGSFKIYGEQHTRQGKLITKKTLSLFNVRVPFSLISFQLPAMFSSFIILLAMYSVWESHTFIHKFTKLKVCLEKKYKLTSASVFQSREQLEKHIHH